MCNKIKIKLLVSVALLITIMSVSMNTYATFPTPSPTQGTPIPAPTASEHKKNIQQFIIEIRDIQNQVFDIAQFALNNPPLFKARLSANINLINSKINSLNTRILEYLNSVPTIGNQNIQVLLALNALNFAKNSLFTLSVITNTSDNVQRISLFDQYFRSRIAAADTLNTLENLILQNNL